MISGIWGFLLLVFVFLPGGGGVTHPILRMELLEFESFGVVDQGCDFITWCGSRVAKPEQDFG